MMGGYLGYLGSSTAPGSIAAQVPDPVILQPDGTYVGHGALRFTNGSVNIAGKEKYGYNERGAILSSSTFPTGAGLQVTFKTVTYAGNSGGAGGDGADGISFFLQDGSQTPGLGAFGGSLAYSCSNANTPHDGLTGALHRAGHRRVRQLSQRHQSGRRLYRHQCGDRRQLGLRLRLQAGADRIARRRRHFRGGADRGLRE